MIESSRVTIRRFSLTSGIVRSEPAAIPSWFHSGCLVVTLQLGLEIHRGEHEHPNRLERDVCGLKSSSMQDFQGMTTKAATEPSLGICLSHVDKLTTME